VTLRERGQLRGCIGSLEPSQPLAETVRDRAILAAAHDSRFPSIRAQELPSLDIEVSVLSPLRRVASADDIDIAKHGVVVRSGGRSGVFLPQVAEETGWNRDELLSHLCRDKAALPADAWKQGAALYVFTVQAFTSPAPGASSDAGSSPGT
ncbi:MAG: AmmeMemoRadiSam system protein A, partial [Armatimonadota bacterium]|nr:AmmeMemoRadiSam system protein A [Armatimonadota bacterium]